MGKIVWPFTEWDEEMRREKQRKEIRKEVREVTRSFDEQVRREIKEAFEAEGWDIGNLKPYSEYLREPEDE